jgi:putative ABC transport system substrate-binding protein
LNHRRRFVFCAAAWGLVDAPAALAQAPGKVYRVGYLNLRAGPTALDEAFVQGMRELGYAVGRNLAIEYRWASNQMERLQELAEELVRLNVDVIVTATTPAIRAAMRATRTIPIVFQATADPVGTGLVASLGRPGGNVTGLTLQSTELARKRLQLMREAVPGAARVGVLTLRDPDSQLAAARLAGNLMLAETQAAAQQMGVALVSRAVVDAGELPDAFAQFQREKAQALVVQVNPLTLQHRPKVVELAARHRLPAIYEVRSFVDDGGLVSYGPDLNEMYRRSAAYVDRIFRGAKPGELAIEQPGKFEMVVNLKTARALGLSLPQSLLLRADEVIR